MQNDTLCIYATFGKSIDIYAMVQIANYGRGKCRCLCYGRSINFRGIVGRTKDVVPFCGHPDIFFNRQNSQYAPQGAPCVFEELVHPRTPSIKYRGVPSTLRGWGSISFRWADWPCLVWAWCIIIPRDLQSHIIWQPWKSFSGVLKEDLFYFFSKIIFQKFLSSLHSYSVLI